MNKKEHNRKVLKKAIKEMQGHKAPEFLWTEIENAISTSNESNKESLANAIKSLPKHKPQKGIWHHIENSLDKEKSGKLISFVVFKRIAAALIIVFALSFLIKNQIQKRGVIEISTVIENDRLFQTEKDINNCSTNQKEIDQLCNALPENCETSVVKELKTQLTEVTQEYEELKAMITNSSEPELLKFLDRIENEKCKIETELLKIIVNS